MWSKFDKGLRGQCETDFTQICHICLQLVMLKFVKKKGIFFLINAFVRVENCRKNEREKKNPNQGD